MLVPSGSCQRWPWTWKVWKSSPSARTSHWTTSPTLAWKTGVLPTNARPSTVLKSSVDWKKTTNSWSGGLLTRAEDRERRRRGHRRSTRPSRASGRGRARPRPARAGGQPVGERLARRDVRARPREARDVRAVGARPVADAVEVHRVRPVEDGVEVLEVDEDRVAHVRMQHRPLDALVAGRVRDLAGPVLRVLPVDHRLERGLRGIERLAHDRVVLVRHDVQFTGTAATQYSRTWPKARAFDPVEAKSTIDSTAARAARAASANAHRPRRKRRLTRLRAPPLAARSRSTRCIVCPSPGRPSHVACGIRPAVTSSRRPSRPCPCRGSSRSTCTSRAC